MLQDLWFAWRALQRSPGFAATAILTLGLGIGATTAMLILVDAVLLHPLDVAESGRVFALRTTWRGQPYEGFLYTHIAELRTTVGRAMDLTLELPNDVIVTTPAGLSRRRAAFVTAGYFAVLGRPVSRGREFLENEDARGAEPVVVLGHSFWKSAFNGDEGIVGRAVPVSGIPMTVIGIAGAGQRGTEVQGPADLFLPAHAILRTTTLPGDPGNYYFQDGTPGWSPGGYWRVVGRLHQDASREAAQGLAVCRSCMEPSVTLVPIQAAAVSARIRGDVSRFAAVLTTAVVVVLVIACVNLAGLIMARIAQRRREIGVRLALGATWVRSVRQLLGESLLIAVGGALCGVVLSRWILSGLVSFELPGFIEMSKLELPMNLRMLAGVAGITGGAVLLMTLTPARAAARIDVMSSLKTLGSGPKGGRVRLLLTAVHVAFSIVLVFGAALFVRSLQRALGVDIGFDASRIAVVDADVRAARLLDAAKAQYFDAAVTRIGTIPGVESVSYGSSPFFMIGSSTPRVVIDGRDMRLPRNVLELQSGPAYFRSLGIPLLDGRDFSASDAAGAPSVAIVNSAFARRFWPAGSALGHHISLPPQLMNAEIVGVADDGKYFGLDEPAQMAVFGAWKQQVRFASRTGLFVRSSDPRRVLAQIQWEMASVDGRVPVGSVVVLRDLVDRVALPQRFGSWLLGGFGVLALLLAVVGIHGLVAFLVAQRTHEIGVRVALGANRADIIALVARGTAIAVAIGTAAGTAAAWWLSTFVNRLLFGVSGHDPTALIVTVSLIVVTAFAGGALPIRRATRVDPMIALRAE